MASKPILFNTEMVRAILEGRKSMTRRVIKKIPNHMHCGKNIMDWDLSGVGELKEGVLEFSVQCDVDDFYTDYAVASYRPGDILWVQETWKVIRLLENMQMQFEYRADGVISKTIDFLLDRFTKFKKFADKNGWQSPYFMPREAARIFLKVTNVKGERLQEITEQEAIKEGTPYELCGGWHPTFNDPDSGGLEPDFVSGFSRLWNSTAKKKNLDTYGWESNPWVWVYEFERVSKDG